MSSSVSHTLPKELYDECCPISSESLKELAEKNDLIVTFCGHRFSQVGILQWEQEKGENPPCPICKTPVGNRFIPVVIAIDRLSDNIQGLPASSLSLRDKIKEINGDLNSEEAFALAIKESESENNESEIVKEENHNPTQEVQETPVVSARKS